MKPSHFQTPRTLAECHFQTGYRCAETDRFTDLGHTLVNWCASIGLVVLVLLVLTGVLQ